MMRREHKRSSKAARQAMELAIAAPQVVAHRALRAATAGTTPSRRDQQEFWLMGMEKVIAFNQSWFAMFVEAGRASQQMALATMQACWAPWIAAPPTLSNVLQRAQSAALDIASAGTRPIHRRAVANARRLGRTRR